jgi:NMD protein affecting ribosome stability and mRNA decay
MAFCPVCGKEVGNEKFCSNCGSAIENDDASSYDSQNSKFCSNCGSQIDVMPTILDYINLRPSVERYEEGKSLYSDDLASRSIYLSSVQSYALVENGYFYEFRDKNNSFAKVTQLSISQDFDQRYETVFEGTNEDIVEKYNRTKRFFKLQEKFLINQK